MEDLAEHREWMKSVPEQLDDKKVEKVSLKILNRSLGYLG